MAAVTIDGERPRRLQAGAALAGRGLEAVGKFALYGLAARNLGAEASGRFFLCLGVIQLIATLARLGLERPLTRHVAAERAVGDLDLARRTMMQGACAILTASLIAAAGLWLSAPALAHGLFHDAALVGSLRAAALVLPAQNLAYAAAYVLIGLDRAATAQMVMNTLTPYLLTLALVLWRLTSAELLCLYAVAFALCALIGAAVVLVEPWHGKPCSVGHEPLEPLWRAGAAFLPVELSQAALLSLPVMLVGMFATATEVSGFSIASRVSMLVATMVISIGAVAAPTFARHHRRGEWAALRADNQRALVASLTLCLPAVLGMAVLAKPVLGLMHAPLPLAAQCLWVLLVGQLAFCLLPCQDTLLAMTGHARSLQRLALFQVAVCVGVSLVLIPRLGGLGAAIVSASVWTLGAIGSAVAARRLIWNAAARAQAKCPRGMGCTPRGRPLQGRGDSPPLGHLPLKGG